MSTRIATGGRLLNKSNAVSFSFNGKQLRGFEGDTLASAYEAQFFGRRCLHTDPVRCYPQYPGKR